MKMIRLTATLFLLAPIVASAQWQNAATPAPVVFAIPLPPMSGTLKAIIPRDSVELEVAPNVRKTFRLAKKLVVVAAGGKAVNPSTLQSGAKVSLHFMPDGNEIIVDRIFVQ